MEFESAGQTGSKCSRPHLLEPMEGTEVYHLKKCCRALFPTPHVGHLWMGWCLFILGSVIEFGARNGRSLPSWCLSIFPRLTVARSKDNYGVLLPYNLRKAAPPTDFDQRYPIAKVSNKLDQLSMFTYSPQAYYPHQESGSGSRGLDHPHSPIFSDLLLISPTLLGALSVSAIEPGVSCGLAIRHLRVGLPFQWTDK